MSHTECSSAWLAEQAAAAVCHVYEVSQAKALPAPLIARVLAFVAVTWAMFLGGR